ncbi:alpha/beta-hydrolase [Vararia minispora EC-137]|uniref:Alpha/beta-hydrolase n=1 Tax=Vararia minispora EC-137 TaxID=1314806 RepID=A0ACB8QPP9_9AGAM|nr:alpha/beta-hydrolase [Vararia minispora EC-137]
MLSAQHFVVRGPECDGGLEQAFVRYAPASAPPQHGPARRRLSLLFLHAIASHKEAFLPTIEHVFALQTAAAPRPAFVVVDAWAMDCPNHGRAAVLNDARLCAFPGAVTGAQWARALQVLFASGLVAATALVAIGHSAGACVVIQATTPHPLAALPFESLILIEPTMMTPALLQHARTHAPDQPLFRAAAAASARTDTWPSRSAARAWLAQRAPWRRWDARALDAFVTHALADLPTAAHPDLSTGVTLACARTHEAASYRHHDDSRQGLDRLAQICDVLPVHAVFGARRDMVTSDVEQSITDPAAGRRMRSIVRVPGAGHLVVQEDPRGTARAVWDILCGDYGGRGEKGKM